MKLYLLNERYKSIPGFSGYKINEKGKIVSSKSGNGRAMKGTPDKDGYDRVTLYDGEGKGKHQYIHKLVAKTFLGPSHGNKNIVGHKDGHKRHNSVKNLEYQTVQGNTQHAYDHGLANGKVGSDNPSSKLSKAQADAIRASDASIYDLAEKYGVSAAQISYIKNGKRRSEE